MPTIVLSDLYDDYNHALLTVHEIEAAGVPQSDISLVASNADDRHDVPDHTNAATDAVAGAAVGTVVGGGAGILAGLGVLAIPGVGPVVAAGWLVAAAVGVVAGASAGAATGGLIGSLTEAGISTDDAHVYAESVRRGGTLVTARVDEIRRQAVGAIMGDHHPVDMNERGRIYRGQGWTAFDETAIPYTAAELKIQREPTLIDNLL